MTKNVSIIVFDNKLIIAGASQLPGVEERHNIFNIELLQVNFCFNPKYIYKV